MLKIIASLATIASLAAAAPAIAQDKPASVVISHADLDLSRPADVAILNHRIEAAVASVCAVPRPGNEAEEDRYQACRASTLKAIGPAKARAIAQASAPVNVATR